ELSDPGESRWCHPGEGRDVGANSFAPCAGRINPARQPRLAPGEGMSSFPRKRESSVIVSQRRWVPAFAGTTTVATAALFLLREIPGIHLDECVGADIFPQRRIDVLGRRRCDLRVDFCVVEECAAEIGLARKLAGEPAVLRPR